MLALGMKAPRVQQDNHAWLLALGMEPLEHSMAFACVGDGAPREQFVTLLALGMEPLEHNKTTLRGR